MDAPLPPDDLLKQARQVMTLAYAPYSHFTVGVCLRATDGRLFNGCNIENASYGLTLCAEACALATMIIGGQRSWREILIISSGQALCAPCGACRQRLFEFSQPDSICHLSTLSGDYQQITMAALLPLPFGSHCL